MRHSPTTSKPAGLQDYNLARIEAHALIEATLEHKFRDGIQTLQELQQAVQDQLNQLPSAVAPWRHSDLALAGCRDGIRLAALEFYWEHRDKGREARSQCSAQCSITDEIQNSAMNGREPELSERSQKHLATCDACCAQLPFWLDLARAFREVNEEDEMIWAAQAGDPAIAQRNVAGGLALFKPSANSGSSGLLLIVDPKDWMDVRSVHKNATRQDFLAMS